MMVWMTVLCVAEKIGLVVWDPGELTMKNYT